MGTVATHTPSPKLLCVRGTWDSISKTVRKRVTSVWHRKSFAAKDYNKYTKPTNVLGFSTPRDETWPVRVERCPFRHYTRVRIDCQQWTDKRQVLRCELCGTVNECWTCVKKHPKPQIGSPRIPAEVRQGTTVVTRRFPSSKIVWPGETSILYR